MTGTPEEDLFIECSCGDVHDDDCIVGFVLDRVGLTVGAVVFDAEEARALRALRAGGLLPKTVRLEVAG